MARYALRFKKGNGPTSEIIPLLRSLTGSATSTVRRNYFEKNASIGLINLPDSFDPQLIDLLADGIRSKLNEGDASLHKVFSGNDFAKSAGTGLGNQPTTTDHSGVYHVYGIGGNFPVLAAVLDVYFIPGEKSNFARNVYRWAMYGTTSSIKGLDGDGQLSYVHPFADDSFGIVRPNGADYLSEYYKG